MKAEALLKNDVPAYEFHDMDRLYRELIDSLDGVIFECDASDFHFTFVSKQCERMLGYTPEEWLKEVTWEKLIHPDDLDPVLADCVKQICELKNHSMEYRVCTRDGRVLWVRHVASVIPRKGQPWMLRGVLFDITEQKRRETVQRILCQICEAAAIIEDVNDFYKTIHKLIVELVYAKNFYIALYDQDSDSISFPYFVDEKDKVVEQPQASKKGLTGYVVRTAQPLLLSQEDFAHFLVSNEIEPLGTPPVDWLGVPLKTKNKILGVVAVQSYSPQFRFSKGDKELLTFVAQQIAGVIERKQAKEQIRLNEIHYRTLFDSNPHPMWVWDAETLKYLAVNDSAIQIYGYSREEFLNMTILDIRPTEEAVAFLERLPFQQESATAEIQQHRKKDGTLMDMEVISRPIQFANRRAHLALIRDVTEIHHAQKKLEESEAKYKTLYQELQQTLDKMRNLFDSLDQVVFSYDVENLRLLQISPACEKLTGFPRDYFYSLRWNVLNLVYSTDLPVVHKAWRALTCGKNTVCEFRIIRADGQMRWVEARVKPVRNEQGFLVRIDGFLYDMTERRISEEQLKRTERALRESEEKYRTLFEQSQDAIFISSPNGRFLDVNPAAVKMFGYASKEEILSVDIPTQLYVNPADWTRYTALLKKKGRLKDYRTAMKKKNGGKLIIQETTSIEKNEEGEIVAYRGIMRDVTNLHKMQEHLLQIQKIEAIGRLAGGLAHDFNNLLMGIRTYADLALYRTKEDDPLQTALKQIVKITEQGASLTRQLLAFSRKHAAQMKILDLNDVIREMVDMISRLIGEGIELCCEFDPEPALIQADPVQIQQIMMNLAVNAKDAMEDSGILRIEVMNVTIESDSPYPQLKPGQYVCLKVRDNGCGMDEKTKSKLFEPFFTTKEPGKGTGLGLSTVHGIVRQFRGHILVESEPGKGATFLIYFPRSDHKLEDTGEFSSSLNHTMGKETILLVDDNESVRVPLSAVLEMKGYKVLLAENGKVAVDVFEKNNGPIDLVITDLIMPQLGGKDLADQLRHKNPNLKVLFICGFSKETAMKTSLPPGHAFLSKPASIEKILSKIRELLDNPAS